MKKYFIAAAATGVFLLSVTASLAAGITLRNGGLGQLASDSQNFGVAVCNGGTNVVAQSVPVSIVSNGVTANTVANVQLNAGACTYTYVSYAQFGMQAGQTYSVSVTIDPANTVISNQDNQATYSVTVPGNATAQTANVNAQSGDFFAMIANFFANLFSKL